MTDGPLYRVTTAYTLSQYRKYNRTVQHVIGKVWVRIYVSFLTYLAVGLVLWALLHTWYAVPIFAGVGAVNSWMIVRNLRRAEDLQYQQEQLVGTVVYEFNADRMVVSTDQGSSPNPYSSVTAVLEVDDAYYIMFANNSGAILPKEDCPPGLEDFLRASLPVRRVRSHRPAHLVGGLRESGRGHLALLPHARGLEGALLGASLHAVPGEPAERLEGQFEGPVVGVRRAHHQVDVLPGDGLVEGHHAVDHGLDLRGYGVEVDRRREDEDVGREHLPADGLHVVAVHAPPRLDAMVAPRAVGDLHRARADRLDLASRLGCAPSEAVAEDVGVPAATRRAVNDEDFPGHR